MKPTFLLLSVVLLIAKLSGIAGIVAMFCAERRLGAGLLALDGILLTCVAIGAYIAWERANDIPLVGVKDYPKLKTLCSDEMDGECHGC